MGSVWVRYGFGVRRRVLEGCCRTFSESGDALLETAKRVGRVKVGACGI